MVESVSLINERVFKCCSNQKHIYLRWQTRRKCWNRTSQKGEEKSESLSEEKGKSVERKCVKEIEPSLFSSIKVLKTVPITNTFFLSLSLCFSFSQSSVSSQVETEEERGRKWIRFLYFFLVLLLVLSLFQTIVWCLSIQLKGRKKWKEEGRRRKGSLRLVQPFNRKQWNHISFHYDNLSVLSSCIFVSITLRGSFSLRTSFFPTQKGGSWEEREEVGKKEEELSLSDRTKEMHALPRWIFIELPQRRRLQKAREERERKEERERENLPDLTPLSVSTIRKVEVSWSSNWLWNCYGWSQLGWV